MAQTAPARTPFSQQQQTRSTHHHPRQSTGRKLKSPRPSSSEVTPASTRAVPPPSPSDFPSLVPSSSPKAAAATDAPATTTTTAATADLVEPSNGPSWARVSSQVLPEAPKGSLIAKLHPSSTGPSSPYARPATTTTTIPSSPTTPQTSRLPTRHAIKRSSSVPRHQNNNGPSTNNIPTKRKSTSQQASHRKSHSQSSRLPVYAHDHNVPSVLLKPLSPKSSSLSPLAPSFSFKPRTSIESTSSSPRSSNTPHDENNDDSNERRQQQHSSTDEAQPTLGEHLSPTAPAFEPPTATTNDDNLAATDASLLHETAPVGLGLSSAGEQSSNETQSFVAATTKPQQADLMTESEPTEVATNDDAPSVEEIDLTQEAAETAEIVQEQQQKPAVANVQDPEQQQDTQTQQQQGSDDEATLPEPLIHATENIAKREQHDQQHQQQQQKDESSSTTELESSTSQLPEPLVHALENKLEQEDLPRQEQQQEDLPTSVEQVPVKLQKQANVIDDDETNEDIPLSAEQVVAEQTLADVLDVDEVPAEQLKQEMDKLKETDQKQDAKLEQAQDESKVVVDSDRAANLDQDEASVDNFKTEQTGSAPRWEPFEDPELSTGVISQTKAEDLIDSETQLDTTKENKVERQQPAEIVAAMNEDDDKTTTPKQTFAEQQTMASNFATDSQQSLSNDVVNELPKELDSATDDVKESVQNAPQETNMGLATTSGGNEGRDDDDNNDDNNNNNNNDRNKDPNSNEAPSLTMAIVNAWHSTTWAKRIPAIIASVAINFGLPFVNGVMLGFGELFARNWIGQRMGWGNPFRAPGLSSEPTTSGTRANTSNVGLRGSSKQQHPLSGGAGLRTTVEAVETEARDALHSASS
ncbi:hypothetical protein OIO90_000610 [Microbotryomycetes sp. JL221]|nr:hypothetical protein OIO90_000610 [Microbotryomycetes sp. JL221]